MLSQEFSHRAGQRNGRIGSSQRGLDPKPRTLRHLSKEATSKRNETKRCWWKIYNIYYIYIYLFWYIYLDLQDPGNSQGLLKYTVYSGKTRCIWFLDVFPLIILPSQSDKFLLKLSYGPIWTKCPELSCIDQRFPQRKPTNVLEKV